MRLRSALLALSLLIIPAVAGAHELLVCYPGQAGDTTSAQPTMDALCEYLEKRSGLKGLHATYFNAAEPAVKWKADKRPSFGILSLSCYLRWKHGGEALSVVAASERRQSTTQKLHVLVNKASAAKTLADLKGKTIASNHVDDERFVTHVVFDGAPEGKDPKLKFTKTCLSAIKKVAAGKTDDFEAVLIDDDQLLFLDVDGLAEVKAGLRSIFTSKELPLAPIVAFGAPPEADQKALAKAFLGMVSDAEGKAVLEAIQASGFKEPDAKAYEALVKSYAR